MNGIFYDNYDMKAFDGGKVGTMISTLEAYKKSIDDPLARLVSLDETQYEVGFKGFGQVKKVKQFVDDTIAEMKKMSDFLLEFKEALYKVHSNYINMQGLGIKTTTVEAASVSDAGDLTGVRPFSSGE